MASDKDRLRILLALAVLKCKPSRQTCYSYVLDLRLKFPPNQPYCSGQENLWKDRALKLEKECEILKENLEATQIQSFISANNAATKPADSTNRSTSPQRSGTPVRPDVPNKKKSKQKQGPSDVTGRRDRQLENPVDLKVLIQRLHYDKNSKRGKQLFEALDTFFELASLRNQPGFPENALLLATRRSIDALSVSLDFTVKKEMNLDRLGTFELLLRLIIEKSFPVVAFCSSSSSHDNGLDPFDVLLNQLQTTILIPVIRSFLLLSTKILEHSLDLASRNYKGAVEQVDGRPALLALFQTLVEASCATISICSKSRLVSKKHKMTEIQDENSSVDDLSIMVQSLILESIRHLDQILTDRAAQVVDYSQHERDNPRRVMRIAVKDTLWYLCSVLHVLIAAQAKDELPSDMGNGFALQGTSNSKSKRLQLLKKTVLNYFVDILSRQDRQRRVEKDKSALPSFTEHDTSEPARSQNETETIRPFMPATHVLLDAMEHRMLLRVVEGYFNTQ